jgi:RimJ/RimL family protein N-acetyltransferase
MCHDEATRLQTARLRAVEGFVHIGSEEATRAQPGSRKLCRVSVFAIDRVHPPRRIVYRGADRFLELRPWSLDDVDPLLAAVRASLQELRAYMPWAHQPLSREGEYDIIARFQAEYWAGRDYTFGMFSEGGEILGGLGLHARIPLNPRALEVGYWCHSAHAGRGWTTLAVKMAVSLVFDGFRCDRLQVMHDEANAASRAIVEKCGFQYEGTSRKIVGEVSDEVHAGGYLGTERHRVYAITDDDLPRLSWLPEIRSSLVLIDALGGEHRFSRA